MADLHHGECSITIESNELSSVQMVTLLPPSESKKSRPVTESASVTRKRSVEDYAAFIIENNISVPVILDGKFFQVTEVTTKGIRALCMLCVKIRELSASLTATTNLLTHVKVRP